MNLCRQVHADPDVFLVEIPLPNNALRTVNSYIVLDGDDALVIDTGFDSPVCLDTLSAALAELGVQAEGARLFVTHEHTDHYGLVGKLPVRKTLLSPQTHHRFLEDATQAWADVQLQTLHEEGVAGDQAREMVAIAPTFNRRGGEEIPMEHVGDGDSVEVGRHRFTALHTPGHAEGHLCLYLPECELLFTGDHVLFDISPNISHWAGDDDPLADYLASLARVRDLPVSCALPGHRKPRASIVERVDDLLFHHEQRLEHCMDVLAEHGPCSSIDAAQHIPWVGTKRYGELGLVQQLFALGETRAHLEHLVRHGSVHRELSGETVLYSR